MAVMGMTKNKLYLKSVNDEEYFIDNSLPYIKDESSVVIFPGDVVFALFMNNPEFYNNGKFNLRYFSKFLETSQEFDSSKNSFEGRGIDILEVFNVPVKELAISSNMVLEEVRIYILYLE